MQYSEYNMQKAVKFARTALASKTKTLGRMS